ncbi:MAG: secondary thiamine-phosphate synthase enzyme YjbQ [Candidatus Omnitrophica bacterium]|nr:secondary thiamine-phosphate synthase enzyme YjbQ [Candidatus Omnitrophota bacterium]
MHELNIETQKKEQLIDITTEVSKVVAEWGIDHGICAIFIPHTTAAVTINENADPDVKHDILLGLNSIAKNDFRYKHAEGNSVAHIKSTLVGASISIPVKERKIALGQWQGIYFCEFDGPRKRTIRIQVR